MPAIDSLIFVYLLTILAGLAAGNTRDEVRHIPRKFSWAGTIIVIGLGLISYDKPYFCMAILMIAPIHWGSYFCSRFIHSKRMTHTFLQGENHD